MRENQAGASRHLDPDLDETSLPARPTGWRGAVGQVAAARAHLSNQAVGPGSMGSGQNARRCAEAKRLKQMALDNDRRVNDLLQEGVDLMLAKYGQPSLKEFGE